jgi:hypothetical protein
MDLLAAIKRKEKKVKEQLGKLQLQLNGLTNSRESLGKFGEPRTHDSQETRHVGGQPGKNRKSRKTTLGQGQGAGKEGCCELDFLGAFALFQRRWRKIHEHQVCDVSPFQHPRRPYRCLSLRLDSSQLKKYRRFLLLSATTKLAKTRQQ